MRHEVALILIVCGTLLVLAPPISDYATVRQITQVMADRSDIRMFNLGIQPMSDQYRLGCWLLGGLMVSVGVIGSWRSASVSAQFKSDSLEAEYH